MLKELRFVMGAVAKKDLVVAMKHFCIENGTIRAYNGSLGLCAPIAIDINCKPKAKELVAAISHCSDDHTTTLTLTDKGRLRITNGAYRVFIDCLEEETPHVQPEGDTVRIDGAAWRRAFENLLPFVGNDASRPWTNGILLHAQSAFATNNVIVSQFWIGIPLPLTLNIPSDAVRELLRIGEDPTHVQVTDRSITFHFDNGKWIRTGLFETNWPELTKILDVPNNPVEIKPEFFAGLEAIKPFLNKQNEVYFRNGKLHTSHDDSDQAGASYELVDFPHVGCYALPMLELLNGTARSIDFSTYPGPCLWFGDFIRGAIIGRRIAGDGQIQRDETIRAIANIHGEPENVGGDTPPPEPVAV